MPGESISFDITASGNADRKFRETGNAALFASGKIDIAAASIKAFDDATAKMGKAATTSQNALKTHVQATKLLADAENVLGGKATVTTKLLADQGRELDKAAESAGGATSRFSALAGLGGGAGGGGMGALAIAGAALAPVIASVGTGVAGLGLAAYGIAKPIQAAAQATGGLQANMAKLNPEQQKVAQGLLGLGQQFGAFQKQMQPSVFRIFNEGLHLAGTLLHGIEPVAASTGKALGDVLASIDAEFKSGTWQQFFGFMAKTAGPDLRQIGTLFTSLLDALPPLLEALQPIGKAFLTMGTDAARALVPVTNELNVFSSNVQGSAHNFKQGAKAADSWVTSFTDKWIPGARAVNNWLTRVQHSAGGTSTTISDSGDAAAVAGPKFFSLNGAVRALNTSMTKLVGNLLTLQGSEISWKQALQSAQAQLRSNTAGLEGNSKNALANRQAVLSSTQAAISFATQQLTLGKNIDGADRTVQAQINWLQSLHDKSQFVRDELHALRLEEQKLEAEKLRQTIHVQGLGQWSVSQSLAPGAGHRRAMGGLIPGTGSADNYPALLTPGEVVVPKGMVSAGAVDHLRGRLPGFAAGGIVPHYAGAVAGLQPWVKGNDATTIRLIDQAVVKATLAGMKAAASAFTTVGGGAVSGGAVEALARRMFPWPSYMWTDYTLVESREAGWNIHARNPSSGAYGLAQFINGPSEYYQWGGNPFTAAGQLTGMFNYIASRYGNPLRAWGHELSYGWYGNGTASASPGWAVVGERGPELVRFRGGEQVIPSRAGSAGGGTVRVQLEWAGGHAGDELLTWIRRQIRIRGGNVQQVLGRT